MLIELGGPLSLTHQVRPEIYVAVSQAVILHNARLNGLYIPIGVRSTYMRGVFALDADCPCLYTPESTLPYLGKVDFNHTK